MLLEISSELEIWFSVSMRRSMDHFRKYLQENNLTATQMNMLMHLYYLGPSEITQMTSLMETHKSAVSQLVERMANQELLERVEVPGDRRSRELRLTGRGKMLVEGGIEARQKWFEDICALHSPEEQAEIYQALCIFNRVFSSTVDPG